MANLFNKTNNANDLTTNPFKAPKTVQRIKDVAKFTAETLPIIGDGIAIKEIVDEVNKEDTNWFLVGALGGATILGLIPGVGDAAARLVKKGAERALDVSKRIEFDLNTLGSTGGNIKIKPEDVADIQAKKIKKVLEKEKNLNDNFYMLHGGADFDKMDLKFSGKGEVGSFRPLGEGIYGSRIVDPKNIETIKNAYLQASGFSARYGTKRMEDWAGFSHPLYKQAFKDSKLSVEATEDLLKELHKKVPIQLTTEELGKIHLFKVPRTKDLKVYDFRNRKGISQNTENVKITYPKVLGSPFAFSNPKFGDSQVVLQPLGAFEEMAIHDTDIVERVTKFDLPPKIFKRELGRNPKVDEPSLSSDVTKLKEEAKYISDREKLDTELGTNETLYEYPEDVENFNQENYLKEMQEDLEVGRRNVFVPEDKLELGEDSTQLLGLDSGKRISKKTVEYNKGGTPMNRNNYRIELVSDLEDAPKFNKGGLYQEGGMQDDGMNRDPVSGNEIPPGSLAKEVRDDIPAQLSEGEYVVPADVVQYYGLKFFEDLRDKAKMALARMERDGRIGGEPVDTEPQMDTGDFPFSVDELQTFNEGGTPRGYQPGGGVTFVSTPATTMQPNPLTYVSPVVATPQVGQTSNFGTGVSGNVYKSGITAPANISMPSISAIETERYINDQCSELTLLKGQGAPAGYELSTSPKGIEYSKACFPERYPDDQQDTSTEEDTQTTAEPEDTQVAQAEQDDQPGYEKDEDTTFQYKSTDVFFEDKKTGENFVAKVGGRDGYAGDGKGPAKNWTYDDYSEYLRNLESGVGNIYGSIPIVSNLVKKRHKEVLKSAKERLTSGLNSDGKTLSVNERIVLENVLLHKELGGLGSLFNLAKDEEIGNINDLIELDKEIQTADGVTYTIKYVGVNAKGADKYGYIRIIDGKQVDSSKLSSVLSDASSRSVWENGAKYNSYALRDFLATGITTVTDLAGNQHMARIRGDYYQVGGTLTPIKDIMEEIGDPELAMKLANNPSLLLGYLPPALRGDGKDPNEQGPGYQQPNFQIKPGIDQGGFIRPDQTDPFSGSFTPDLFDPAYDDIEKTNIPPTSIETSSVTADTTPSTTPPTTQLASAGFGTSSLQQTADIVKNISQQDDETLDAMGDVDDTPGYEKTSSDVLVEQQKAREKQAQDNEDRRQARQEAKVSQAYGGGQAAEKFTASQDDDDDDAVSKGQQQGKGYTGGFGFRKGGMPKQTIQMEKVKI